MHKNKLLFMVDNKVVKSTKTEIDISQEAVEIGLHLDTIRGEAGFKVDDQILGELF